MPMHSTTLKGDSFPIDERDLCQLTKFLWRIHYTKQ